MYERYLEAYGGDTATRFRLWNGSRDFLLDDYPIRYRGRRKEEGVMSYSPLPAILALMIVGLLLGLASSAGWGEQAMLVLSVVGLFTLIIGIAPCAWEYASRASQEA